VATAMTAPTAPQFTTGEYLEAGSVVGACAGIGAILAWTLSRGAKDWTAAGALTGALVGMYINWRTRCPVCMATLEGGT